MVYIKSTYLFVIKGDKCIFASRNCTYKMTLLRHTLLALLLSCCFAAPLKARDKIHRIPPTSAGNSKIIEPDHLSLKAKVERQVMPQTEGIIKRTVAEYELKIQGRY